MREYIEFGLLLALSDIVRIPKEAIEFGLLLAPLEKLSEAKAQAETPRD